VKRGEVWTAAGGSGYTGKPRPVVVIQDDRFDATDSVTVCAFTTDPTDAPLIRLPIEPAPLNGLHERSALMVDKLTTVQRSRLGARVGRLSDEDMVRLGRAVIVFLGLAGA
jgi:mRNA interferase MazF